MKRIAKTDNYFVTENGVVIGQTGTALTPDTSNAGYARVAIYYKDGSVKKHSVHRLVAEAFIPNVDSLPLVNHKDGNKLNNCVENLEWVSHKGNYEHAHETGLLDNSIGENHYLSKYTEAEVREVCELLQSGMRNIDIERTTGVHRSFISMVRAKKAWRHISKEYNIQVNRAKRFSESTIRWLCDLIAEGKTNAEIISESRNPEINANLLHGLRKRKIYTNISKEYNF